MKKAAGMVLMLVLSVSLSARNEETIDPSKPANKKDSVSVNENLENRGFKNLFTSENFNPAEPYATQINPKAVQFVEDYLARQGKTLESMKVWGQPYFRMMDAILSSYGVPKEMKYLAVIESHLKPWATSWAGAAGPWQFMPETGRRMGLMINSRIDERANYTRSTQAAAKYLKELYGQLGDWLLVIAAYNGGPGRVFSAIRKSGSKDFWDLQYHLPEESRNHVKKFIGTHYLMEGTGGLTTSTAAEWKEQQIRTKENTTLLQESLSPDVLNNTATTTVEGKYNSLIVANHLGMSINIFNSLNPNFDQMVAVEGGYSLRLPKDKLDVFQANRFIILRQSLMNTLKTSSSIGAGYPAIKATPTRKK